MIDLNSLPLPRLFEELTSDGSLQRLLDAARSEDLGDAGDVTTASMIDAGWTVRAIGVARETGVVCGMPVIRPALKTFDCAAEIEVLVEDGHGCERDLALWRLHGELGPILGAERTVLNLVGRLSGIATVTAQYVKQTAGTRAVICDTRKTTPGLRGIEKYAVRCGGGTLHRLGLHDAVLLKDNHLAHLGPSELVGAVTRAATAARQRYELRFVEVEVDDLQQFEALLGAEGGDGVPPGLIDIVLLDNMPVAQLRDAVALRDHAAPDVQLEASGGIGLADVRAVAATGVDRISVGALTHAARWLDVSLEVV